MADGWILEARVRIELEPVCGRERSGSPQAKSRAQRGISGNSLLEDLEARVRIELTIEVLQTSALPLGYRAS